MMKIRLKVNMGQGITIQGTLDSIKLSADLAPKMIKLMRPDILSAVAKTPVGPDMVDVQQYEITIMPEERKQKITKFQFSEAGCPDELLDLLDELMHEIINQKFVGPVRTI